MPLCVNMWKWLCMFGKTFSWAQTLTFTKGSKKQKMQYDVGKTQKKHSITGSTFNMTTKPTLPSHDEEQRHCIENKMLFGTHRHKCGVWISPITQSWQERQIWAYPKNVNLPVLGQGNLPLNRLQLLSSEERWRKIFETESSVVLIHVLQTQWLPSLSGLATRKLWHCFSVPHSHTPL